MLFLIIIFALVGLWVDGIFGLAVGGALGYVVGLVVRAILRKGLRLLQAQFIESTFAVMGALCKADGVVTRDEIRATEELFIRLGLSSAQKETAKAAFNRGKGADFALDAEVDRFVRSSRRSRVLFQVFLQVQLIAVAADGKVHPAERVMLVRVARRLGMSDADVAQLEALLRAAMSGAASPSGTPLKQQLEDAYAALGLAPEASASEIKRAYRKLMTENHPDRLAANGMPESMRNFAEERSRELNAAYDLIRKARDIS